MKYQMKAMMTISMERTFEAEDSDEALVEAEIMKKIMAKAPLAFIEAAPGLELDVQVFPLVEN